MHINWHTIFGMLFWLNMCKYCSLRCFKTPTRRKNFVISLLKFKTTVVLRPTTLAGSDNLAQTTRPRETRCKNKLC